MSDKAEWAYRTISEVSEELDVPPHVLRFWETKFSQLKPMKRSGSRRYYKASDLDLLIRIRDLLYRDGFTIKGAQKALREKKPAEAQPAATQAATASTEAASAQAAPQDGQDAVATKSPIIAAELTKVMAILEGLELRLEALLATKQ